MNCVNHPDRAVASYCQNCGKALCTECVRPVSSSVYCEQCLAERLGHGRAEAGGAVPMTPSAASPALAAVLGFIPGVGAMYNGQYVKALIHVLVFVVLVGLANTNGIFGILIAGWVFYQVFEAYQTARARRFGMPLPDPFGLNDLGNRIGMGSAPGYAPSYDPMTGQPVASAAQPGGREVDGAAGEESVSGMAPGAAGFTPVGGQAQGGGSSYGAYPPYVPVDEAGNPLPPPDLQRARREPIGAIVLIGLGMLFLFNSLGIFDFNWVGRGWPLILIGIGIWLLVKRTRGIRQQSGGQQ